MTRANGIPHKIRPILIRRSLLGFACILLFVSAAGPQPAAETRKPVAAARSATFENAILPIVRRRCLKCHNPQTKKGSLDLSTFAGVVKGSESGEIVVPGKLKASRLLEVVSDGSMPPGRKERLTRKEIETIRNWIKSGARSRFKQQAVDRVSHHRINALMLLRCTVCHGGRRREADLDLRTVTGMLKGGKSGPAIVAGMPAKSLLLKRVHVGQMPPPRQLVSVSVKPMTDSEIKLLETWIRQGARTSPAVDDRNEAASVSNADRRFWSFQTPKAARVPRVRQANLVRNPIDAFLLRKLETKGLSFASEADRAAMLRRLSLDLTGLPPPPEEVLRFLNDHSQSAYERVVEQLLASPRYGERWGRHWLDVAGYADSEGAQNEDRYRPHIWRYRDYVVRAFNADKPYDRFLKEQLAGDELADYRSAKVITPQLYDNLVATGFLRTAPDRTFANITNFVPDRLEVIADEMQIVGTAVLGLTVQCARCHSHKFDPVSQADYYRLKAIFQDAYDEHDWLKSQGPRTLPYVTTTERTAWKRCVAAIDAKIVAVKRHLKVAERAARKRVGDKSKKPLGIAALKKRDAAFRKIAAETDAKIKSLQGSKPAEPRIRALWSRGTPSPTYLLRRGNYLTPARPVTPNVPAVLRDARRPFTVRKPGKGASSTGRRLAFAEWVTHPSHPLTARVMVNRIWRHHFGRGLVTTPDNFGKTGARPSHPELLDWLAVEFVRHDWSIKHLHRLIVTSTAYRQSSNSQSAERHPELFAHMPLRRMEAEALRDSLLYVSGELDARPYGPPDAVSRRSDGLVTSVRSPRGRRRSIYVRHRRTTIPTLLDNFDSPQMGPNCVKRGTSIVAPQALILLNSKLVHELSKSFADRVIREAGSNRRKQLRYVYLSAYGRLPSESELKASLAAVLELEKRWVKSASKNALRRNALANFCHAVMNSAEFLFVD